MNMPKAPTMNSHTKSQRTAPYNMMPTNAIRAQPVSNPSPTHNERPSTAWSQDDDIRLMQYRTQGMNWAPIASHFTGKSSNACRKRHERLMEKKNNENYDTFKVEDLGNAYLECREEMWKIMAAKLGEPKWQTIETKCMEKGFKNLQTAARARRNSRVHASPPASHNSDSFEDSGLVVELDQQNYPHASSSSPQNYSMPPGSSHMGQHIQPSYQSYGNAGGYMAPYSMPPPVSAIGGQTLPSLSRGFDMNLPPVTSFMGRNGAHTISASYA